MIKLNRLGQYANNVAALLHLDQLYDNPSIFLIDLKFNNLLTHRREKISAPTHPACHYPTNNLIYEHLFTCLKNVLI